MRVEEATLLTLESVDLKNLYIRIQRLKNGVSSQKPLWRHNAKLLRSYLRVRQDAGPWLFTGRQGALKKRQIQQLFTDYAKQAGIKGRSIHSLRHTTWKVICLDLGAQQKFPFEINLLSSWLPRHVTWILPINSCT